MYERFTDRARTAMQLANEQAQRFNLDCIGTEQILLGLINEGSGAAAKVLINLDVNFDDARAAIEGLFRNVAALATKKGTGPALRLMAAFVRWRAARAPRLPLTPRAKKVIEHSLEEGQRLGHNYVGTEHLLLGLLRDPEATAAAVLMSFGLTLEQVRQEVLSLLGHSQKP